VYDIHVRNNSNNTRYAVIVDPGNGKVLYKQVLPSSSLSTAGHAGMFGKDMTGPFFGGHCGGYRGHGHWSNDRSMNNDAGNFAGRVMHMSVPVSIDVPNNGGMII
jgi:hypothetical protein